MILLLTKLLLYKLFYYLGFPKLLPLNYTISLTYNCNSKCSTCFVYERKAKELSLDEYKKIFKSIGKSAYWVTFSGGEPFLKKDFTEIVKLFYDICKPKIINIPTNGILNKKIIHDITDILAHCKKAIINVNLSIDGVAEQHDAIRNVEGSYKKAIKTFQDLKNIKAKNLSVAIHTVISKYNIENFAKIANTMLLLKPDKYITEIAEERNELHTVGKDITPDLINYKAAVDFLIHRIKYTVINKRFDKIAQAFRIEYYTLVKKTLKYQKQTIPCYAGITSVQISPDGDVWYCCVKAKSVGNLRKAKYNFKRIWISPELSAQRKSIRTGDCYCPLANVAYTNMLLNFRTLYKVFYRSFIKWR